MNVTGVAGYTAQQIGTGSTDATKVQSAASSTETKTADAPSQAAEQDTVVISKEALRLSTLGGGTDWPDPPKAN